MPDSDLFQISTYYSKALSQQAPAGQDWLDFFDRIAERIKLDIQPRTVFDAGCAAGVLLQQLEKRAIQVTGRVSDQTAWQQLPAGLQPACQVSAIQEPLSWRYDLILALEVLAHVPQEQAEQAVANFCQASDEVLVSFPAANWVGEDVPVNRQSPAYWGWLFARHGYYHDLDFDASFISPTAARFCKSTDAPEQVVARYERRLSILSQENQARRVLYFEHRDQLALKEDQLRHQKQVSADLQARLDEILSSTSWRMMQKLQRLRERVVPLNSRRERWLLGMVRGWRILRHEGLRVFLVRIRQKVSFRLRVALQGIRFRLRPPKQGLLIDVDEIFPRAATKSQPATVDIVICVHNALQDVQRCLASVLANTTGPYTLILVDDGSGDETRAYLAEFAGQHKGVLERNDVAQGYTLAANQGLRRSTADFVILLNSDTIVTPGWVDRMLICAQSNPEIGVVGPLSNTASWQSIPEVESQGDWAENVLPEGYSVDHMGALVAEYSARLYPEMKFLNGFCLMIRRALMDAIGLFDEQNFGQGYGEENDYCLRARKAGWRLALADDAYVYHAQSRSYNHERRKRLSERASQILAKKHGQALIDAGVAYSHYSPVLEGMRARSRAMFERQEYLDRGSRLFAGRKLLFVLPIKNAGGGGNVVMMEADAMRKMGVDVQIFNFRAHQPLFDQAYPDTKLKILYGEIDDLPRLAARFDAVVATFNPSVAWMAPAAQRRNDLLFGYYIQDFEPWFYEPGTPDYQQAWNSYNLIPNMVRFTKTEWTRAIIREKIGVDCVVVGASLDVDLFMPRPALQHEWPDRPLRIGAMIRPSSPRRSPALTMDLFQQASRQFGPQVEFWLFGTTLDDPGFADVPRDFPWTLAGILNPNQVANFLNQVDIFVDFSTYQAMGLTALEAMASGVAVILPQAGGAHAFARQGENCLLVDTASQSACWEGLRSLIENHDLRKKLQSQALKDAPMYYPEAPAYRALRALFWQDGQGE